MSIPVIRDIRLPDVGEGLDEATIVEWLVGVGDEVALNQPIGSIQTAKAEVELPSSFAGRVVERNGEVGATLRVGELLLRIETSAGAIDPSADPRDGSPTSAEPAGAGREAVLVGYGVAADRPPLRRRRRWQRGEPVAQVAQVEQRVRVRATPPVRKLARDLGVELGGLTGTGPDDVITRDEVIAAASGERAPAPAGPRWWESEALTPTGAPAGASSLGGDRPGQVIPVRGVRGRIAERMTMSRRTIPDATCGLWVDCSTLLATRKALKDRADSQTASAITPFALMMRFLVLALRQSPLLNASYDEGERVIRVHQNIHLGIGTSTSNGLLVPVVRHAEALTTVDLAREIARLVETARQGGLAPEELSGSTFTVTNFGALGLDDGSPVINPPEAAIVGIGAIRERPVAVHGELAVRPTAKLICSFDHRVCDGAEAANLLRTMQALIEGPAEVLLHV
ncbi:MAG TPA: dihydrolipoamide acetyltransferase family protein [Acidimicrobiales bacterium]|nr:dihydrolipoamide acetyltransferase family protein [Acidimicrobiales bacterium]